jgi:DNA-binding NtrC family response regulator
MERFPVLESQFPWARIYALKYPVRFDELGGVLDEIRASHSQHRDDHKQVPDSGGLIGNSAATNLVRSLVDRVAPSHATVLINGESGTG